MVSGKSKRRQVPPSRLRYEASHPTATVRVARELHNELKRLRETAGLSMAEVLKVGLEKAQASTQKTYEKGFKAGKKAGRQTGYRSGKSDGFEVATEKYAVSYYCARCRYRHLTITTDKEKEAAANLMYEAGWHNPDCERR